jgi:hypothetical protein
MKYKFLKVRGRELLNNTTIIDNYILKTKSVLIQHNKNNNFSSKT